MPIDPNIAMGYRAPQLESPVNQMAAVMQMQGLQQTNELNRQKMEEYARAREMEGMRRNALAGVDFNAPDSFNTVAQRLYNIGDLEGADKMLKARDERDYKQAQTTKEKATAEKTGAETKVEKLKFFTTQAPILAQNPTDQAVQQWATSAFNSGAMNFETANAALKDLLSLPPDQRSQKLMKVALSADKALEQHFVTQNLGGTERVVSMPKYGTGTAAVVPGSVGNVTKTPHEIAMEAQARERLNKEFSPDNVAHVVTNAQGDVMLLNKQGKQVGTTLQGAGKPSATFEKTAAQQKQLNNDRKLAISELEEITKDGGLIDKSTSSYAGKGVDILARTIGTATPGDIAASQLAPIADLVLKMVPRFEGPQSDKDTASYKQAAGQLNDATLPAKLRKAAGKEILRLMKTRENQFQTADMAAGNVAVPNDIRSQADAIINGGK